jgi:hypothetical protein
MTLTMTKHPITNHYYYFGRSGARRQRFQASQKTSSTHSRISFLHPRRRAVHYNDFWPPIQHAKMLHNLTVGTNNYSPLQNGHNELPPRWGAQIIKQAKLEIIISGIGADASHIRNYTKMRYAKLYNQKICNELFALAEAGISLLLAEE